MNTLPHSLCRLLVHVGLCGIAAFACAAQPGKLHPLPPANVGFAAPGTPAANAPVPTDPRAQQLAAWLTQRQAQVRHGTTLSAYTAPGHPLQKAGLARLQAKASSSVLARFRRENGTPLLLRGENLEPRFAGPTKAFANRNELTARTFLRANRDLLRLNDPEAELRLDTAEIDNLGRTHLRFLQSYRDLPVWPAGLSVHLDPQGNVDVMDGAFVPTPSGVEVQPRITQAEAIDAAHAARQLGRRAEATDPELIIYAPLDQAPRLAWKFDLTVSLLEAWRCVIDARTGEALLVVTLVPHAGATGSGQDSSGQNRSFPVWQQGNNYYLIDTTKKMYDASSQPPDLEKTRGAIVILDAKNTPPNSNPDGFDQVTQVTTTTPSSGWVPDAVSAAFGLSQTYDYYLERHNRNSLDNRGATIIGIVRLGVKFPNAYWNGKVMAFGDGFTKSVDVTGHELTHGVINSIGNGGILVYHKQPGALNESLADIFGEMVEARAQGRPDWLKGAQLGLAEGPIQNYADPHTIEWTAGRKNPAKMSEFAQLADSQDGDNGGVHINSSIINHAFYLLAEGAADPLGIPGAANVFYRAMTLHLEKESQFIDMRHACLTSAEELFGKDSTEVRKVGAAFDAVEIFDAPEAPAPAPIPTVAGPDSLLFLRHDFFLFDGLTLYRREDALRDDTVGTLVDTIQYMAPRRVSVSGDGTIAVFITEDNDLGLIGTDGSAGQLLNMPGLVHSVAMSPDGNRYAFVLLDNAGQPTREVAIVDLKSGKESTIPLYAPGTEGAKLDIVQYADSMDFTADGQTLVYDAFSEFKTKDGATIGGWTLFALDLPTQTIRTLIDLDEGMDFGNPSLGNSRGYLLTYEVQNKATGDTVVYAGNLVTGESHAIAQIAKAGELGYPAYSGDDTAVIYTQVDSSSLFGYSLMRQPIAADGFTPTGQAGVLMQEAAIGVVYRRGSYSGGNVASTVSLTSPQNGQQIPAGSGVTIQATATDPDGTITKVEFYDGSTKLGEDATAPYAFMWTSPSAGTHRLVARVIDHLGGATDSAAVTITVGSPVTAPTITTPPQSMTVAQGTSVAFNVVASGNGTLTYQWKKNGTVLGGQTTSTLALTAVTAADAGDYTVTVTNEAGSVTSAPARLTVQTPPVGDLRVQSAQRLANGTFQLTFNGATTQSYRIEASSDLRTWTVVGTITPSGATTQFIDADAAKFAQRFYRIASGSGGALPGILTQPKSQTVKPGATVTLSVSASGSSLRYQWYKNDALVAGAGSADLRLASVTDADGGVYRVEVSNAAGTTRSIVATLGVSVQDPVATMPTPAKIYPAGTVFGGPLFGVEFTIPSDWKGGLRANSPFLLFGSDTKPGLILGLLGFAGTEQEIIARSGLNQGFDMEINAGSKAHFQPVSALASQGNGRLSGEFSGSDASGTYGIYIEATVHPSGGYLGFLGLTTQAQFANLKPQVQAFAATAKTTARPTNRDFMQNVSGRSFKWSGDGREWFSNQAGVYSEYVSTASWTDNHIFFCGNGEFEVNKESTSYIQAKEGGGGDLLSASSSSTTTEYGEWTVIKHPQYGDLLLLATYSGYQIHPVRQEADGGLLVGQQKLSFYDYFNCGG